MGKMKPTNLILLFVFAFVGILCSYASDREVDKPECISIGEIWKAASACKDKQITISGDYLGWKGPDIQHPMITRSDWIIRDATGGIYVSGKASGLDPVKHIGTHIIVKGVIKVSKKGVPYVKAEEVIIKQ